MFYVILDMIYVKIKKNDCYILFNDFHILCKCFMLFVNIYMLLDIFSM